MTRIANTPAFIKGVTNLRGVIVPIIDLRVKFAQQGVTYNENTVVIVLNLVNAWWVLSLMVCQMSCR